MLRSSASKASEVIQDNIKEQVMSRSGGLIKTKSSRSASTSLRFRHNPHVIYQFESHLKSKRVDDNPKVLGNIIKQKFKMM